MSYIWNLERRTNYYNENNSTEKDSDYNPFKTTNQVRSREKNIKLLVIIWTIFCSGNHAMI